MYNGIPKEIQYDGDWPWVTFKNTLNLGGLDGIVISKDVGGLTLVATWVRTDSFIDRRDEDESVIEDET
jgi:hypothetical protein